MLGTITPDEEAQLLQTIEMFEVITQSQPLDYQSLEILKEAYLKLGRQKDIVQTSKRIADAYVQLGQLSSAILEYETILQRFPDDPDVLEAMVEIENKAKSLTSGAGTAESDSLGKGPARSAQDKGFSPAIDDGRQMMQKVFVEGKLIGAQDFDQCWMGPRPGDPAGRIIEPFIQIAAEKSLIPLDKSLKLLSDKTRLGYLPMEKYDVDLELAQKFPREICQRWCVVPFDKMSKSILVATCNPFNNQAAQDLQAATQSRMVWYLASPTDVTKILRKVFR